MVRNLLAWPAGKYAKRIVRGVWEAVDSPAPNRSSQNRAFATASRPVASI